MLFNSWLFVAFVTVVFLVRAPLPNRFRSRWLLLCSYVFYGAWDVRFLVLIFLSTVVDYWVGRHLPGKNHRIRQTLLWSSIVLNIGLLGVFKYFDFFSLSLAALLGTLGWNVEPFLLDVVLPVGISFYTFQTLSYTIDVYRGDLEPCHDFWDFALFVSFFPQLVAGPIERAGDLQPQLKNPRPIRENDFVAGSWLILRGAFKKMVLADNLARLVDPIFADIGAATWLSVVFGTYAFAYQIYCDFSGYTDIARGLARFLGVDLVINFNRPFVSATPAEFWRRWHISLLTWLRDYVFIPLGGSRGSTMRVSRNVLIVFLLGGLWHGASWNFVLWGLFHGMLFIAYRRLVTIRDHSEISNPVLRISAVVLMFHFVAVSMFLFRMEGLESLMALSSISALGDITGDTVFLILAVSAVALVVNVAEVGIASVDDPRERPEWNWLLGSVVIGAMVAALIFLSPTGGEDFLYFQF